MELGLLTLGDHLVDPTTRLVSSQAERFKSIIDQAVAAEAAGLHAIHVGEHHFCGYIVSAPPVLLAAISQRTERIRLSTGVTLTANNDPVRLAEDYAAVDVLSDGRVEIVTGRGSAFGHTFGPFGQHIDESRVRNDEAVELLLRLWTEEDVHWHGTHRAPLDGVTAQPRPVQQPHPPIWIGGGSSFDSVDLAARLGLPLFLPSVLTPPEAFVPVVERYESQWEAFGHDPAARKIGACIHAHVASDNATARRRWEPYYMAYLGFVMELLAWSNGRPHRYSGQTYDDLLGGPAVCGDADEVGRQLERWHDLLHLDRAILMLDMGGIPPGLVTEQIAIIGQEVQPRLTC